MATRIGCDNLVYCLMKTEDTATVLPVYDTVKPAPGVMHVNINPNGSQETLFADDGPMEVASTLGKIDVEIQKNQLTSENKADLLGHELDEHGGVIYADNDVPPFVAIAFRTLKSNGKYRYVWLYKGKFNEPEDQNETKGDSINFQSDTISGQFTRLNCPITVNNKAKKMWKYELDAEDAKEGSATIIESWFSKPVFPGAARVASTS